MVCEIGSRVRIILALMKYLGGVRDQGSRIELTIDDEERVVHTYVDAMMDCVSMCVVWISYHKSYRIRTLKLVSQSCQEL